MTESRSERTERRGWLAVLILLFVVIGAWQLLDRDEATPPEIPGASPGGTGGARPASGALGAYVQYVDERRSYGITAPEPGLTVDGIQRLAAAIAEVGNRNVARSAMVRGTVDSLYGMAERVAVEAEGSVQARRARQSFISAAAAITRMQEHGFPTLGELAADMRGAAEAVSEREPLAEQRAAVQSFFERAAAVLRNMSPQAV